MGCQIGKIQGQGFLARLATFFLWSFCACCLLGLINTAVTWWWESRQILPPGICPADGEGQWAIGIFKGPTPFSLQPLELVRPRTNTPSAWPVANPVFTCAHVTDVSSAFVADPFLWPMKDGKTVYLFFETKSQKSRQGDIGAAVSTDGGLSFAHIGIVLDEPWHLSYPYLVEDEEQMYMIPEGSKSGTLRLYRALSFPSKWVLDSVLIDEPLIDASLIQHDGKWWMFASNRRQKSSKNCREMEIWSEIWQKSLASSCGPVGSFPISYDIPVTICLFILCIPACWDRRFSDALKGPWRPHSRSPVRQWVQGSRQAGRPVKYGGEIYRFGQDCEVTYGHRLRVFRVTKLTTEDFEEEEVPFAVNGTLRPGVDWNGLRYHHLDAHELSNGDWIAAMDGDKYASDYLIWRRLGRAAIIASLAVLIGLTALWVHVHKGGLDPAYCAKSCVLPLCAIMTCSCFGTPVRALAVTGGGGYYEPPIEHRQNVGSGVASSRGSSRARQPLMSRWKTVWINLIWPGHATGTRVFNGVLLGKIMLVLMLIATCIWALAWFVWAFCRPQVLYAILWYVQTWSDRPDPIPVDGQFSKFTVIVMSYEARVMTLQAFLGHYSRCPSVGEVVVVWNKGAPPDPLGDLKYSGAVPLRVRVEAANSMNNRFRPDPDIVNRGILMLDDDIIMPCADVERGFAQWRHHPERVTGFYPRILEGDPPQYRCIKGCESYTYDKGTFNIVLAGAAFMDRELVFEAYSSDANSEGRAYVDRVFNCDDLLLNYLMAQHLGPSVQYAEYVRPSKRFDVGKLTSKRLSTGNFGPVRHNCTRDFAAMFGNPLLGRAFALDWGGLGKPVCGPSWLGCIFI